MSPVTLESRGARGKERWVLVSWRCGEAEKRRSESYPILLPPSSPRLPAPLPFQIVATTSLLLPRPGSLLCLDGLVHHHDRNEPNPIAESRNIATAPCSAAAEAARELRDAVAALAVRRAADEDALRRRAIALDADVRRLQGSLAPLDPATLDELVPPMWSTESASGIRGRLQEGQDQGLQWIRGLCRPSPWYAEVLQVSRKTMVRFRQ
ncbi:uncharacterized protein [Aegilops tauschii subsp. strangulata]|uniref:uncharacterized protein n=1 Tax=Aegilops tauschii subsp. strangulata TaxID=200361 RepID=UPI003CC8581A